MRLLLRSTLCLGLFSAVAVGDETHPLIPTAASKRSRLPTAEGLPLAARDALALRMSHHAVDLEGLLNAALMLDHALAETEGTALANSPRIGRPLPGEQGSLSALLPPRFFSMQDKLAQQAQAVAMAARIRDDRRLAKALGALTRTCVECHSVYLKQGGAEPRGSEDDSTQETGDSP
jgi:hypothetical protein